MRIRLLLLLAAVVVVPVIRRRNEVQSNVNGHGKDYKWSFGLLFKITSTLNKIKIFIFFFIKNVFPTLTHIHFFCLMYTLCIV